MVGLIPIAEFKKTTDVGHRSDSRVPHIELVFVCLCVGDEFLEIVRGKIFANSQQLRLLGDQSDRFEVFLRVVAQIGIKRGRRGVRAHVPGNDGVAIGRRAGGAKGADGAAGATHVLDHKLLAEMAGKDVGHDTARNVGRSARRKRHNHRHRPRGVALRPRTARCRERQKRRRDPSPLHRFLPHTAGFSTTIAVQRAEL